MEANVMEANAPLSAAQAFKSEYRAELQKYYKYSLKFGLISLSQIDQKVNMEGRKIFSNINAKTTIDVKSLVVKAKESHEDIKINFTIFSILKSLAALFGSKEVVKNEFEHSFNVDTYAKTEESYFAEKPNLDVVVNFETYHVPVQFAADANRTFYVNDTLIEAKNSDPQALIKDVISKMMEAGLSKVEIDKVTHLLTQRMSVDSCTQLITKTGALTDMIQKLEGGFKVIVEIDKVIIQSTTNYTLRDIETNLEVGDARTIDKMEIYADGTVSDLQCDISWTRHEPVKND